MEPPHLQMKTATGYHDIWGVGLLRRENEKLKAEVKEANRAKLQLEITCVQGIEYHAGQLEALRIGGENDILEEDIKKLRDEISRRRPWYRRRGSVPMGQLRTTRMGRN